MINLKNFPRRLGGVIVCLLLVGCSKEPSISRMDLPADSTTINTESPYLVILGIAQDGGSPQAGSHKSPGWKDLEKRKRVVSLGLVSPSDRKRWMFEATPDFRDQWFDLASELPDSADSPARQVPDGIFLTHAHIGHYTGLMFLGHESMGAIDVPVYAMPQMAEYLSTNGPWMQLVRYNNITLNVIEDSTNIPLAPEISVLATRVPHRQEFSEVVGYTIRGPNRSAFFLPDIDSWEEWDSLGVRIEDVLESVDIAFLDATFFDDGEIPGRDMSTFPHPKIRHTMERLDHLPAEEKGKVYFIHLNHTNPAADVESAASREISDRGFHVARRGQRFSL